MTWCCYFSLARPQMQFYWWHTPNLWTPFLASMAGRVPLERCRPEIEGAGVPYRNARPIGPPAVASRGSRRGSGCRFSPPSLLSSPAAPLRQGDAGIPRTPLHVSKYRVHPSMYRVARSRTPSMGCHTPPPPATPPPPQTPPAPSAAPTNTIAATRDRPTGRYCRPRPARAQPATASAAAPLVGGAACGPAVRRPTPTTAVTHTPTHPPLAARRGRGRAGAAPISSPSAAHGPARAAARQHRRLTHPPPHAHRRSRRRAPATRR